jgi:chorismate mutase/prephenate dehydratase
MNRIESRPAHTGLWQYAFFIDVGGHIDDGPLREVVADLEDFAENVTVLGSYPVAVP